MQHWMFSFEWTGLFHSTSPVHQVWFWVWDGRSTMRLRQNTIWRWLWSSVFRELLSEPRIGAALTWKSCSSRFKFSINRMFSIFETFRNWQNVHGRKYIPVRSRTFAIGHSVDSWPSIRIRSKFAWMPISLSRKSNKDRCRLHLLVHFMFRYIKEMTASGTWCWMAECHMTVSRSCFQSWSWRSTQRTTPAARGSTALCRDRWARSAHPVLTRDSILFCHLLIRKSNSKLGIPSFICFQIWLHKNISQIS